MDLKEEHQSTMAKLSHLLNCPAMKKLYLSRKNELENIAKQEGIELSETELHSLLTGFQCREIAIHHYVFGKSHGASDLSISHSLINIFGMIQATVEAQIEGNNNERD